MQFKIVKSIDSLKMVLAGEVGFLKDKFSLLCGGLFPETLPPCFDSHDAKRAFQGLEGRLDEDKFKKRSSEFIRYSGTKHNGGRRFFGTPNIVAYFNVSNFIHQHWTTFQGQFQKSKFSIGSPIILDSEDDRAIKVPSLSELSLQASQKLRYSPLVLKTDISQFFPSIYTHSLSWAAHGREASKLDTNSKSENLPFNALDSFIQKCQSGQTRGVLVGPDAFRLVAEFISSEIDSQLSEVVAEVGIGAVRHVDDYYFGIQTETSALILLSRFREILAGFELQINDNKTQIQSSLEPINDLWAQRLRMLLRQLVSYSSISNIELALNEAMTISKQISSDSPVKMLLRRLDEIQIYRNSTRWDFIEPFLQRICQSHSHALDYVCLLVVKRVALDENIDIEGWKSVAQLVIDRGLSLNNHHEVVWMLWLLLSCEMELSEGAHDKLDRNQNDHIKAMLVQAFVDGRTDHKAKLSYPQRLSTSNTSWLSNLVAKSQNFSGAKFSGDFSFEFDHIAQNNISLINFEKQIAKFQDNDVVAISRSRYGYDDDDGTDDPFSTPSDPIEVNLFNLSS
jgi:hypothetical protein